MTGLARNLTGTVSDTAADATGQDVSFTVIYNPLDPCAVVFDFGDIDIKWRFARDLLVDALATGEMCGDGDVTAGVVDNGCLALRLASPDGECIVRTELEPLAAWVRRTLILVPAGAEYVDVDAMIAQILGASHG